ncbi:hypothetical protein [Treponema vincentii]|uniref:hypothetical protein n=1 Tax=Treponema vincentii TaxID=69710 RepID=UPI00193A0CA0|nr:hypothetical protein [Treponema vincentii]
MLTGLFVQPTIRYREHYLLLQDEQALFAKRAFSSCAIVAELASAILTKAPEAAATGIFPHEGETSRCTNINFPDFFMNKIPHESVG